MTNKLLMLPSSSSNWPTPPALGPLPYTPCTPWCRDVTFVDSLMVSIAVQVRQVYYLFMLQNLFDFQHASRCLTSPFQTTTKRTYLFFSTVIEHIRKVHCAERDDQIRAQDQLIQQQSNKIEHSKSVEGSVNANGRKHHPLSNKSKRPFVCPTCSKGFAQKIHLETHLKNVHLKDKPYKCSFCEYSCANKGTTATCIICT